MKKIASALVAIAISFTSLVTTASPASAASASPATITVSDCSVNSPTVSDQAIFGAVNDTFTITNSGTGSCRVYPGGSPKVDELMNTPTAAPDAIGAYWSIGSGASMTFKILGFGLFRLSSNAGAGDLFNFYTAEPLSPSPAVSASGSVVTFTTGAAAWASQMYYPFACPISVNLPIGPSVMSGSPLLGIGCTPLYTDGMGNRAFGASFDLRNAYMLSGPSILPYVPATAGEHIVVQTAYGSIYYVTASTQITPWASSAPSSAAATPYTGPVVNPPALSGPVARGGKVTLGGSNLSGVTKVEINGLDCAASVNSDGELEITVPPALAAGTYDLVVTSSSGKLTVQDGIRVSAESVAPLAGQDVRPSAKKNELAGEVKVRLFDVVGAGKVQIFVNGKEIAWVNAADASDSKLFDGYLVRTVALGEGKTAIEVFVDGVRVQRWAYSK